MNVEKVDEKRIKVLENVTITHEYDLEELLSRKRLLEEEIRKINEIIKLFDKPENNV